MARKKGRDISGWLVVDKPAGVTSTAVVNKVRWAFDAKKAGHAGTLDPAATGVLAVALGEATKTVPFITDALKCYRFTVQLGTATETDDDEGKDRRDEDGRAVKGGKAQPWMAEDRGQRDADSQHRCMQPISAGETHGPSTRPRPRRRRVSVTGCRRPSTKKVPTASPDCNPRRGLPVP